MKKNKIALFLFIILLIKLNITVLYIIIPNNIVDIIIPRIPSFPYIKKNE